MKKTNQEDFNQAFDPFITYSSRSVQVKQLMVSLDEPIVDPKYYRPLVDELLTLTENDSVIFRINSPGGRVDGLISLLNAMGQTEANILTIIDGECHSAASLFALHSPNISVSPYATMMVHNGTYGVFGKESDIINMVQHQKVFGESLIRNTYEGFLTPEEIDNVLNGREYWFIADEIEQRLENRAKYFEAKNNPEPKVEPKRKRRTPKEVSTD